MEKSPLLWALKRMRRRVPALLVLMAAESGLAILSVVFALGTRQVIDSAISGDSRLFLRACVVQFGIIAGSLLCITVFRYLKERLSAELDRDWKKKILHDLLHGSFSEVSAYHSGELINRLNNDVRVLDEGILNTIPGAVSMVLRLFAAMAVLVTLEPWFAAAIIGAGMAVVLLTAVLRHKLKDLNKSVSEADGKVSGFLQELLEKLLMVQALDVAEEMEQRADCLMNQRFETQRKRKNITLFANTSVSLMSYGASFVALVWCSVGLLNGTTTFGSLTAVMQLVSQLQGPFVNLSGVIPQYVSMVSAAERLMELEKLKPEASSREEQPVEYEKLTAITARHLYYANDRGTILEDASFCLPKGAFAVITGPSGIGKSTLLKLMLGVIQPASGALSADCGETQIPLTRATRKLFAYVPQGNLLISGTLLDNLTIVKPDAAPEEIQQAVYVSAMDEFLPQLPRGLDTVLGENSAGLSEGQAQRLAIARAVLSGAPILLLDEGTSALDAQTERTVLERIRQLQNRTCIAVTHRPAAMEISDWNIQIRDKEVHLEAIHRV